MPIEFDPINRWIKITEPTTDVNVLDIYSAAMDWAAAPENMQYPPPLTAVGKFDMGGGVYSDIIYKLRDGWKLKFWSTTEHFIVRGTLLPESPGLSRHVTPADVEYEVSARATVIQIPTIDEIKARVDLIPTMEELNAAHGSGSWEGATPSQIWSYPTRSLTSRAVDGEQIAGESSINEIKGPTFNMEFDSLKRIRELIESLQPPRSIGQYLEKKM